MRSKGINLSYLKLLLIQWAKIKHNRNYKVKYTWPRDTSRARITIGSPKIGVESFILMIEHILVSILFDLTRATLLSLRNTLTLL